MKIVQALEDLICCLKKIPKQLKTKQKAKRKIFKHVIRYSRTTFVRKLLTGKGIVRAVYGNEMDF